MPTNDSVTEPTQEEIERHFYVRWILYTATVSWFLMGVAHFWLK